jgi:hypothetical protein
LLFGSGLTRGREKGCEERGVWRKEGEGNINRTFKDVWGIHFFGVALFGYGDLVRDLDKVDAGGEIRDAA